MAANLLVFSDAMPVVLLADSLFSMVDVLNDFEFEVGVQQKCKRWSKTGPFQSIHSMWESRLTTEASWLYQHQVYIPATHKVIRRSNRGDLRQAYEAGPYNARQDN